MERETIENIDAYFRTRFKRKMKSKWTDPN